MIKKVVATAAAASGLALAGAGVATAADADAAAAAIGSPGVGSGNNIQVPINNPIQVCGNTIDLVGFLNPVFGNACFIK
ncbi:chaplin [Streptomyces sp. 8K308]|uniref:chaplin n=1 Tax=Streptomyces sp. 8K308 TaxID=2530388 RepID=UPI0010535785|nr:chaplin [Streptomyces sp. 8K308]TDC07718.1 chaplin [Streptomyces sp. 8K308]